MKRAALLLFGLPVLAAERPVPGPMKPFVPPAREERALPSGFRYSLMPFGSLRMARVELSMRNDGDADLAELVANYLLEGTRSRNAAALSTAVSDLGVVGGAIRVSVTASETVVSAEALSDSAPALIRLVAEVVNEPAFPSEALESMKADQLRRMDNRQTQPASRALSREDALLFGIQTSGDVVRAATADSVRQYWSASYRPAAAHLYVAGVFDNEAVDRAVRESFASESSKPVIHLIDRPGATQSHIAVAWPMPDPAHADYFVLNVMNIVMGSMQRSRIIANVREQHGYSYNIFSRLYGRPRSSKWGVSGDVATASTAAALREILAEVARLGEEPPSPGELRRFQTFMSGVLLSERATPEGIVSALRWQELHGLPADDWATFVPRVYAVTPEDLRRVARRYLAPSRAAIVVIGDRKAIEAKLGEVGRVVNE
jgi:zinc protease